MVNEKQKVPACLEDENEKQKIVQFMTKYITDSIQLVDPSLNRDSQGNWNWDNWDNFILKYNDGYASRSLMREKEDFMTILPTIQYKKTKIDNLEINVIQVIDQSAIVEVKFTVVYLYNNEQDRYSSLDEVFKLRKINNVWKVVTLGSFFIND
ncbi:MAG: hypothetical protein KBI07_06985 [Candidatus Atribacteria bacterium]|nr:hypothetical protein [Candidatus Atribacteria bacterium]